MDNRQRGLGLCFGSVQELNDVFSEEVVCFDFLFLWCFFGLNPLCSFFGVFIVVQLNACGCSDNGEVRSTE